MEQIQGFRPIGLARKGRGRYLIVNSIRDAARALLDDWPFDDGEAYLEAVKACLDALTAGKPPEEARMAFIRAAHEADIVVIETAPGLDG